MGEIGTVYYSWQLQISVGWLRLQLVLSILFMPAGKFSLEIQTEFAGHHFLVQRWQLLFTVSVLKCDQNYWAWCLLFYVSKIVVLLLWPPGFKLFQSWKFVSRDSLNDCLLGLWLSFTSKQHATPWWVGVFSNDPHLKNLKSSLYFKKISKAQAKR